MHRALCAALLYPQMQHFHRGEDCGEAGEGAPQAIAVKVLGGSKRPKRGDSLRRLSSVRSLDLGGISAGMFWQQASLEHRSSAAAFHVRQDLQPHPILVRGMGAGGGASARWEASNCRRDHARGLVARDGDGVRHVSSARPRPAVIGVPGGRGRRSSSPRSSRGGGRGDARFGVALGVHG